MNIEEKLTGLIGNYNKNPARDLHADIELRVLGVDSLSIVDLMLDIESEFQVNFDDDRVTPEAFSTIGTLTSTIEKLLQP